MDQTNLQYPPFVTQRLTLRELTLEDAGVVYRHFADHRVTEWMDIEPCKDVLEAEEIIRYHLEDTGTRWGIFLQSNAELIGTCGFHYWRKENQSIVEIGFDLAVDHQGKGYMWEALQPIIAFGFTSMKVDMIDATVEVGNERSIRLLHKLGFEQAKELQNNLYYYSLTQTKSINES